MVAIANRLIETIRGNALIHSALVNLDPNLRQIVESELATGETVVWAAQPIPRLFTAGNVVPVLFAIPWTGFAIFWTVMAFVGTRQIKDDNPMGLGFSLFFPLFGVPFILIGLGMFAAPWFNKRSMKRTVYAITDQRAIILSPSWRGRKVQSFEPDRLTTMERIERRDGSGDIVFEEFTTRRGSGSQTVRRGFMSVPRVREVEDTLRKTLLANRVRDVNAIS